MYLSKVRLNWAQAKNPYEQHRALWQLFPEQPDGKRDFLYRVEQTLKGQGAVVLMQSLQRPAENENVELLAVRELQLSLYQEQFLRFRLRANPIKAIKDKSKGERIRNGKSYTRTVRVPLVHEEQQQAWLERKLAGCASVQALNIQQEMPLNFHKAREKYSGKIQPVLFDGVLMIEDEQAFLDVLKKGIGPAKSLGCGLISLAPA
ncbi:type I-E CRISPR-associated protein Cas6/Cse3/CasE [Oceanospirillum linum]|uniref:Type I-E CRISPR-associated protein Cas6/Cse3/CasE n=1 Tax=Oceanospirillum linum TaxID=966 RepID=A0A1T1H8W3_OCELI|nr:type I-E CRISPR-associated protein Cas6/Cse3/CasE [Oceanospirillum linum]OOV86278.1 type I-E CRISPR-associated protein Cas6/Cse3/CasE [Oceanospirillum linum]SEG52463.1 CRISPR-associated protein, Cse3 family [Oleiphilus messinensis]SMP30599.1 CRISPR-associated protein, Cse3 family [Oceanospirillum linum]